MIVRIFRATAHKGSEREFDRMLEDVSTALLRSQDGMLGYIAGRPVGDDHKEFVMISLWRDSDAVAAFAGSDPAQAVIPDEEKSVIESWTVEHYETITSSPGL